MDEAMLRERMRAAAELGAHEARAPGAAAARRRGRRRQATMAGGLAVLVLAAVAVPLSPAGRALWGGRATPPANGASTKPATVPFDAVAQGATGGYQWWVSYRTGKELCFLTVDPHGVVSDIDPCERLTGRTEPLSIRVNDPPDGGTGRLAHGVVTKAAVRVEVMLTGSGPMELRPGGLSSWPMHVFVAVLPPDAMVRSVSAFDARGRVVGLLDLIDLPGAGPQPAQVGAGDAGWLRAILRDAGYRTTPDALHGVIGRSGGHEVRAWTTAVPLPPPPAALAAYGFDPVWSSAGTTVYGNGQGYGWWAQGRLVWVQPRLDRAQVDRMVATSLGVDRARSR